MRRVVLLAVRRGEVRVTGMSAPVAIAVSVWVRQDIAKDGIRDSWRPNG